MQKSVLDYLFFYDDRLYSVVGCSKEYDSRYERACKIYDKLKPELNEEQCGLFDEYTKCQLDMEFETLKRYFISGFKLGMRVANECFGDK